MRTEAAHGHAEAEDNDVPPHAAHLRLPSAARAVALPTTSGRADGGAGGGRAKGEDAGGGRVEAGHSVRRKREVEESVEPASAF